MRTAIALIGGILAILLTFTPLAPLGMMIIYGIYWNHRQGIEEWRKNSPAKLQKEKDSIYSPPDITKREPTKEVMKEMHIRTMKAYKRILQFEDKERS